MKDRERFIITELVVFLVILWLGFLVHQSPRFAGSFTGGMLGISGAALMLVAMAHMIVKRIAPLKQLVTNYVPMRTLLSIHVHAGVIGAILGLLHTGHKFQSHLGIALTAVMLVVVPSGYVGRYLLSQSAGTIHEKRELLTNLQLAFRRAATQLASQGTALLSRPSLISLLSFGTFRGNAAPRAIRVTDLAESIADVEYALDHHERFRRAFSIWLKVHIAFSFAFLLLLALHIWAALHFGLRWFS